MISQASASPPSQFVIPTMLFGEQAVNAVYISSKRAARARMAWRKDLDARAGRQATPCALCVIIARLRCGPGRSSDVPRGSGDDVSSLIPGRLVDDRFLVED